MTDRARACGPGADLSRLWLPTDAALADALQVAAFGRTVDRRLLLTAAAATLVACAVPRAPTQAAALRSFYVATNGNDANAGTQASPWRTINEAVQKPLLPGDEIVVMPGTYTERFWLYKGGNADTPNGYVTLRSATPGAAQIRPPSGTYSTLNVRANYVIIDGFDIVGGDGHAVDVEVYHHVKILNCICHDSGGSGISFTSPSGSRSMATVAIGTPSPTAIRPAGYLLPRIGTLVAIGPHQGSAPSSATMSATRISST